MLLHSVRFFGQHLDNQLLVPIPPSPHLAVRVYDSVHVVANIPLLSTFIMKRNSTIGKWLENIFDVSLWAASNTYMQVWNAQVDKVLQKAKEHRSWGWQPRDVGALIKCVNDEINWPLCHDKEHVVKTFRQDADAGLLRALPVC